jgi:iron complex outermembrane receptor protein
MNRRLLRISCWIFLACVVAAPRASFAQTAAAGRGAITVAVTDSTGASVADAAVVVSRGVSRRTATTSSDGLARFADLAAGEWQVAVTRDGFATWTRTVSLSGTSVDVPVGLDIAGFSETVQVATEGRTPTQIPLEAAATGGSRLDIPVKELPASLFLLGQPLIQERGARSVEEAVQLAVGMQSTTGVGSIPGYNTRGWSGNNISIMRDGIRQNTQSQSSRPVDAFLLERIEVLKGPASLLYGEGAIGGAVNMVSKSPIAQLGVESLLSYGSYGQYRTGIGVNVPLRRNLFARVDVSQTGSDGYVGDSPQKLAAAAASVRYLPTSNIVLKGSGQYTYDDTSSYYATPFINGELDPRTRDINYNMEDRLTKSHNKWLQFEADALLPGGWKLHNQFFAATHALDWRNFEGYSYNATTNTVDVTSYFLIWRDDLLLGNRLDVRNTVNLGGRALNVMVGVEAQRNDMERAGNPSPNYVVPVRRLDPFNPARHFDPGLPYARQRDVLIETRGVFAEAAFEATSRLKIISGLRWEQIDLGYTPYPSRVTANQQYEPTTGRIGGVFEVASTANVYASYSRAVEPTTQLVSLDGSQQRFSLVPGQQFEIGAKASAFRGRLDGTVAWFNIEKRDLLITQLIDGIQTAQQIGGQSSRGVEFAAVARPTRTLTIAADLAVTRANFDEFIEIVAGVNSDRSGRTPPNVPTRIWNISPTQQIGRIDVTGTLRQVGWRWGDNANSPDRLVKPYTTIEAAVAYRLGPGTRIAVRGRNLSDRLYTQSVSNTAGRLEPGRSVDVTFTTDLRGFGR